MVETSNNVEVWLTWFHFPLKMQLIKTITICGFAVQWMLTKILWT